MKSLFQQYYNMKKYCRFMCVIVVPIHEQWSHFYLGGVFLVFKYQCSALLIKFIRVEITLNDVYKFV